MDPTGPAREAALSLLPGAHALAIRLRDAGLPDAQIARWLEMEPEAVGPLLAVADAKLAAALAATVNRPPHTRRRARTCAATPVPARRRGCGHSRPASL